MRAYEKPTIHTTSAGEVVEMLGPVQGYTGGADSVSPLSLGATSSGQRQDHLF